MIQKINELNVLIENNFNYEEKSLKELIKSSEKILGNGWFDKLTAYTDDNIKIQPI